MLARRVAIRLPNDLLRQREITASLRVQYHNILVNERQVGIDIECRYALCDRKRADMSDSDYQMRLAVEDLRRLDDAASDLLRKLNPEAVAPTPNWLPEFLATDESRAAYELMSKLLLLLEEVYDIETPGLTKNSSRTNRKVGNTGYSLQSVADDLLNLHRLISEPAFRLHVRESRKIGPEVPGKRLRWLAQGVVARAEPVLAAVSGPDELNPSVAAWN
jgi:hypothetical protein